jgi:hypothetical protein
MEQLTNVLILSTLVLAPMGLVVAYFVYSKKRINEKRKNPINNDLLRSPGESLSEKIEDLSLDIDSYLMALTISPLLCYTLYLQSNRSLLITIGLALFGISFTITFAYKLLKLGQQRNKLKLGYDAELAIGQELNTLMRDGYWVFHDLPAENYNIDHVVVGANGVFAVETKGRSKPVQKEGKAEFKVKFDGNQLIFPTWVETKPLAQAKRQASSLQKQLSSAVGESVEVKPVLAIPGWFIEVSSKSEVVLINGKNCGNIFNKLSCQKLDEQQIKCIAHQLDQRCRNVKPQAYKNKKAQ